MKIALTVAGSDSCGGAGIQQDLKVFSSLGVHGTSVITAITAQNTRGVKSSYCLDTNIVKEQLDALFSDLEIAAVKTGMLGNREIIEVVCRKMREYQVNELVIDPVMVSTSGHALLEESALSPMKKLISLARLTTPNVKEAEILAGMSIKTSDELQDAARKIGQCIITGGEHQGRDLLHYDDNFRILKSSVKISEKIHGTGCAFSAAIAAFLAKGLPVKEAVEKSKNFINCSLARNFIISKSSQGAKIADTGRIKRYKDFKIKEQQEVIEKVAEAVELFCRQKTSWQVIPEVGINIAMARPQAKDSSQIAALSGRIVRDRAKATPVGSITFGGSKHLARVILAAQQFDRKMRAAMNIKYSPEIIESSKKLGMVIGTFKRQDEPAGQKTMEWGTKEAIKQLGKVPDIIYDEGGKGKEAMVRILGRDAEEVVRVALRIIREM